VRALRGPTLGEGRGCCCSCYSRPGEKALRSTASLAKGRARRPGAAALSIHIICNLLYRTSDADFRHPIPGKASTRAWL
jgi:hypothetical protein